MAGDTLPARKKSRRKNVGDDGDKREGGELSEYERQRMLRIGENRARLEALGLPALASALQGSSRASARAGDESELDCTNPRRRQRGRTGDDVDDEYRPSEEDEASEGSSSSEGESREEEQVSENKKKKKTISNVEVGETSDVQQGINDLDSMDDYDDPDLLQAIALSLKETEDKTLSPKAGKPLRTTSGACSSSGHQEEKKRRKGVQNFKRPQMNKDERIAYFFSFDEAGSGGIRARDLRRVASAHDFNWTDKEMGDMICLFDSDGDGKLSLDDFTRIISRCDMLKDD